MAGERTRFSKLIKQAKIPLGGRRSPLFSGRE
jgi:hypothetical protein